MHLFKIYSKVTLTSVPIFHFINYEKAVLCCVHCIADNLLLHISRAAALFV